jgi:hypothetical protein
VTSAEEVGALLRASTGRAPDKDSVKQVMAQLQTGEVVRHVSEWTDMRRKFGEAMIAVITNDRIIWHRSRTKPRWVSMPLADVASAQKVSRKEWFVFPFTDLVVVGKDGTRFQWVEMDKQLDPCLAAIDEARRATGAI